jgi:hypothetical protein
MPILSQQIPDAHQISPDPPEPIFDWLEFEQHNPDAANDADDSFLDGGTGSDVLNAMQRVALYLRRANAKQQLTGELAAAFSVASHWNFQIDQARELVMQRHAGTFPRPAA